MILYFAYACVGRILIFIIQRFPYTERITRHILPDVEKCSLCLGVWVYWGLAFLFKTNILEQTYLPIVSELVTGMVTSFLVWVFEAGFKDYFGVIEVK
jgi:hypothetical protein